MANVRIDANGVPKAPVYEQSTPVAHRTGVTEPDASDPEDAADGIDCAGFEAVDFDLDVTLGGTGAMAEVAAIHYDATADAWFAGESAFLTASGRYRLRAHVRGATVFLKVVAITGDTPTLDLDAWAVLS